MKKLKVVLGCIAVAIAATGMAACTEPGNGKLPGGDTVTYTVKFEDGGMTSGTQSVNAGGVAARPANPERVGYTFDGWYLDGVLYEFTTAVDSDITLVAKYSSVLGGNGTEADPFTIDNADELALLKSYIDNNVSGFDTAKYVQTADIVWTDSETIATFGGEYDGGGHSLQITAPLFAELTGKVKNIDIAGNITAAGEFSGVLANVADNAYISRVAVNGFIGNVSGTVGGLVGAQNGGRIEYCVASVKTQGEVAGGIVGTSSGVVINCISESAVKASEIAGGVAGILEVGGLLQNIGAGLSEDIDRTNGETAAFVDSDGIAGGIVGSKCVGSSIYRAFVYGDRVRGKRAGGIVGIVRADTPAYTDIVGCLVLDRVDISGLETTACNGEHSVADFDGIGLPSAVWDISGIPSLKNDIVLPLTVKVTVNGNESFVTTGSHDDRSIELFTLDNEHFSKLIEIDADVSLKTALAVHASYDGSEFTAGNYGIMFGAYGAKFKRNINSDYSALDYVLTYSHVDSFEYLPDASNPNSAYDVDYDAPISVYTDGEKYYAFVVEKQYIGSGMYAAFLQSYVYNDGKWSWDKNWCPKSDFAGGAYKYTFTSQLVYTFSYMIIVDDRYTVAGEDGYYLTRFVMRNLDSEGSYTESAEVISHGQPIMFLGYSENNTDFITAFSFNTDYDGYSDFIYYDQNGKLINSAGFAVVDASADFLVGTWFDGSVKYTFDTDAETVTVMSANGDTTTVAYSVSDGKIRFTAGKQYELVLAPSVFGSYVLMSRSDGADIVLATYMSDALNGEWITEDGDIISVNSDPAYVTFNGVTAQSEDSIYNGVQAIRFVADNKDYYLVTNTADGIAMLVYGDVAVYAVNAEIVKADFVGDYATAVGGQKLALTVNDGLEVTFGGATAKAVPVLRESGELGEYLMRVKLGGVDYLLERKNDVIILSSGGTSYVFTDVALYERFAVRYTNGTETLEITEDGKFRRYVDADEAGEFVELTAMYRDERANFGGEERGFVLCYTDGNDMFFFYADATAQNVRLFRSGVNSNGVEISTLMTNFVNADALEILFGSYIRMLNDETDTLTFGRDGTLVREYTDTFAGETRDELEWYPVIDYNANTGKTKTIVYTKDGSFTSLVELTSTGLNWGLNAYMREELFFALEPYTLPLYLNGTTSLTVGATRLDLKFLKNNNGVFSNTTSQYSYDDVTVNGSTVTISAIESGYGIDDPRTASVVLEEKDGARTVTLTVDGETTIVYTSQTPLDYNTLIGEYECDGDTYAFTATSSWGGMSIQLVCTKGNSSQTYRYYSSDGIAVMSDGSQALGMRSTAYVYRYVWKVGDDLMISESLDASNAVAATDKAISGMPSIAELWQMLDGNEYTASDGSKVSFALNDGILGTSFTVTDGDKTIYCDKAGHTIGKGVYTLSFGSDDFGIYGLRVVVVYLNDDHNVTKLLVGETAETATKEYLPGFVPPTVDEMKAMLLDTGYKAADGKTAMFWMNSSWLGDYYTFTYAGKDYDYGSGEYSDGKYVFTFKPMIGSAIAVTVIYTADGIEKLTISGVDYLPVTLPAADELKALLDGKTFEQEYDSSMYVTFAVEPGLFGDQFVATWFDGTDEEGAEYYLDKITANGAEYTLELSAGFTKLSMTVTLYPDGSVKFVTIDGEDYLP